VKRIASTIALGRLAHLDVKTTGRETGDDSLAPRLELDPMLPT
jgi:hypothetical protein